MRTLTALITGASSGIGLELAARFASDGHALVLVARREELLQKIASELAEEHGIEVTVLSHDLSDPETPTIIHEELLRRDIAIDFLVNNAGVGLGGPFCEQSLDELLKMIELNIASLTQLTRLFLPELLRREQGGILNVASTAAFQPGPYLAVYYATKAFVLSLTEALATETAGSDVTVSCLAPGATQTEFAQRANVEDSLLFRASVMRADKVADIGYRAFRKGKTLIIPGRMNRLGAFLVRFMPRYLVRLFTSRINRP